MRARVLITVIYGGCHSPSIDKAVLEAARRLEELGVSVTIVYSYIPGAKTRIYVNGIELDSNLLRGRIKGRDVVSEIVDIALDTIISEDAKIYGGFLDRAAACTEVGLIKD